MHISCSLRSQAVQGKNHTFLPSNPQQHLLWHRSFVMHDSTSIAVAYLTSPTWCQWSSKGHSSSALLICLKPTKSKLKQVTFQTLYSQWRKMGTNTDHTSSRTSKMGHIIHMFKWLSLKGLLCVPGSTPLDNSWACFRGKMTWKAVLKVLMTWRDRTSADMVQHYTALCHHQWQRNATQRAVYLQPPFHAMKASVWQAAAQCASV